MRAQSLKRKHVDALIQDWQARELQTGTIKNRLADVRWWAEKTGKHSVIANDNTHYGIDRRVYVTNDSKATDLAASALEHISDPHLRMSLRLQAAFGLRREESIKFQPSFADHSEKLVLKASWCKGGRPREIPIRTPEQRQVLAAAHQLAGKGSLIPAERSYVQQRRLYERQTVRAGLSKLHGLRHAYAQQRYRELTGFHAPAAGGPTTRELTPEQMALDHEARLAISRELGHKREQITAVYLGR